MLFQTEKARGKIAEGQRGFPSAFRNRYLSLNRLGTIFEKCLSQTKVIAHLVNLVDAHFGLYAPSLFGRVERVAEWLRRLTRKPKVGTAVGSNLALDSLVAVRNSSPGQPEPCEGNLVSAAD